MTVRRQSGFEGRTLRKGLPRFVVFIIWDEVADGVSGGGMAADEEEKGERR